MPYLDCMQFLIFFYKFLVKYNRIKNINKTALKTKQFCTSKKQRKNVLPFSHEKKTF